MSGTHHRPYSKRSSKARNKEDAVARPLTPLVIAGVSQMRRPYGPPSGRQVRRPGCNEGRVRRQCQPIDGTPNTLSGQSFHITQGGILIPRGPFGHRDAEPRPYYHAERHGNLEQIRAHAHRYGLNDFPIQSDKTPGAGPMPEAPSRIMPNFRKLTSCLPYTLDGQTTCPFLWQFGVGVALALAGRAGTERAFMDCQGAFSRCVMAWQAGPISHLRRIGKPGEEPAPTPKTARTKPIFLSPEVAVFFRLKVEIRTSAVDRTNPFLASWRKRGPGSGGAAVVAAAETPGADHEEQELKNAR